MKKFLLVFSTVFSLAASMMVQAQTFNTQYNTANGNFVPGASIDYKVYNRISPTGPNSVEIDWKITATDFPADWLADNVLGVCDNVLCYTHTSSVPLWDGTNGSVQNSNAYQVGEEGDFHLVFTPTGSTSTGIHTLTVNLKDRNSSYNKNIIFNINYSQSANTATITRRDENVVIYPNPVREQLNVVFTGVPGVRSIAIYNLIGRAMNVYRVNGNSAGMNVENLPSGIYFIRLLDAQNNVIVTRKFTRM